MLAFLSDYPVIGNRTGIGRLSTTWQSLRRESASERLGTDAADRFTDRMLIIALRE